MFYISPSPLIWFLISCLEPNISELRLAPKSTSTMVCTPLDTHQYMVLYTSIKGSLQYIEDPNQRPQLFKVALVLKALLLPLRPHSHTPEEKVTDTRRGVRVRGPWCQRSCLPVSIYLLLLLFNVHVYFSLTLTTLIPFRFYVFLATTIQNIYWMNQSQVLFITI